MVIKVGINGFGRVGRIILRACLQHPDIQVTAINDPAISDEYVCYLIKFDSTHGKLLAEISRNGDVIHINDVAIKIFHEKSPPKIPWDTVGVEYVVEASGMFTSLEKASGHLANDGLKRVIVTAPSIDAPMIIMGVNQTSLCPDQKVLSSASSTLYCLAPIIKVLQDNFGVEEGFITSIHAMTPSLKPLDGLCLRGKHWRDHRSIHQNIIPASTGACKALGKIIPEAKNKLTGLAFRVPIVNVSVLDLTIRLRNITTLEEIMKRVDEASKSSLKSIIKTSNEETVSSDFIGETHSCIVDEVASIQHKPNSFKIICWYENEYSYACRVVDSIVFSESQFQSNASSSLPRFVRVLPSLAHDKEEIDLPKNQTTLKCNPSLNKFTFSADSKMKMSRLFFVKRPYGAMKASIQNFKENKKRQELLKACSNTNKLAKPVKRNRFLFQSFRSLGSQKSIDFVNSKDLLEYVKIESSGEVNKRESGARKSISNPLGALLNPKEGTISTQVVIEEKSQIKKDEKSLAKRCNLAKSSISCKISPLHLNDYSRDKMVYVNFLNDEERLEYKKETKMGIKKEPRFCVNNYEYQSHNRSYIKQIHENRETINKNMELDKILANAKEHLLEHSKIKTHSNSIKYLKKNAQKVVHKEHVITTSATNVDNNIGETKQLQQKNLCIQPEIKLHVGLMRNPITDIKETETNNVRKDNSVHANMKLMEDELKKHNFVLLENFSKEPGVSNYDCDESTKKEDTYEWVTNTKRQHLIDTFKYKGDVISDYSRCESETQTSDMIKTGGKVISQDIFDKLASCSDISRISFEMNERQSQIIQITDIASSLEDLERLDKICKVIEISDELSDRLFSPLDDTNSEFKNKRWSFRDFCERIKLDDFCNEIFGKTM